MIRPVETFVFYLLVIGGVLFFKLTTGEQRAVWAWDFWTALLILGGLGFVYELLH